MVTDPGGVLDAFDTQAADDFVIPPGRTWQIESVIVAGAYFNPPAPAPLLQ